MATNISKQSGYWKLRTFITQPSKLFQILRDKRTPFMAKALPILAVLYVLFPLDILPDFIPIIGQIDDITVVLYLLSLALDYVPDSVFNSAGISLPEIRETI